MYGYRPLNRHTLSGPTLALVRVQQLNPSIHVELVGGGEVFGRGVVGGRRHQAMASASLGSVAIA